MKKIKRRQIKGLILFSTRSATQVYTDQVTLGRETPLKITMSRTVKKIPYGETARQIGAAIPASQFQKGLVDSGLIHGGSYARLQPQSGIVLQVELRSLMNIKMLAGPIKRERLTYGGSVRDDFTLRTKRFPRESFGLLTTEHTGVVESVTDDRVIITLKATDCSATTLSFSKEEVSQFDLCAGDHVKCTATFDGEKVLTQFAKVDSPRLSASQISRIRDEILDALGDDAF